MIDESGIRLRYEAVGPLLDERGRRRFAAAEALAAGHGGILAVSRITGVARSTIGRGLVELREGAGLDLTRARRPGGGRKALTSLDATLLDDLRALVDPATRGDPQAPLLWTSKSLRHLAEGLRALGHKIGHNTVATLLRGLGYSLQANRKTLEGASHPDRDAQFHSINQQVGAALAAGEPAISVDTKKMVPELGRAAPYGVYDIGDNKGWVSVGVDHDTADFAVAAIRRWWQLMGQARYPKARHLVITADGGGSNGSRLRLWKLKLQSLADELGLTITICHLPPGTSKWNKIEHRLFSFITQNWRGRPLVSHQVIVELIAATTTKAGLTVRSEIDPNLYPAGVKVTDQEMTTINIHRHDFHGDWNYTIAPQTDP